ncbi:hypothetical protein WAE61_02140 [Comamonadaceae bacterium PP-2]
MPSPQTCSAWPGLKPLALLAAMLTLPMFGGCAANSSSSLQARRSQTLTPLPAEISAINTESSSPWSTEASEALDSSELWLEEVSRWSAAETLKSQR